MSKVVALDLGDQWVGVALSDALKLLAKPYTTIPAQEVSNFIQNLLTIENIQTVVIGYPKTMKGGESKQTKKVISTKHILEQQFPSIEFVLWDERLSSKRAEALGPSKTKQDKLKSHALAAAFILDSYLLFLTTHRIER